MWFGKKNAPLPTGVITTSDGLELEIVTSYKYLGVWLDGTLSFSQHISKLQANVKSILGFLYCNRSSFTPAAKLTLIQMTILPMLDYGDVIYRSAGLTPPYLRYLLQPSSSTYNTRSANHILLNVPKAHTFLGRSSFQFAAASN
ncbi:unnamed protein product [Oncorhynchus mykiss]|uniref:Uncharacterized protein n=1 Tax=Oncorhynchus mykiss TaxID=8022 RepID=A0A060XLT9_ONCMY|nr:unnamed protein product [Oncorhynchus mykiss]